MEALWMQNKPLGYNADLDRQLFTNLYTEGVLGTGFAASQRAAGANMSADLTGGVGVVTGDDTTGQGRYLLIETAPVTNVPIAAAPLSGTRHDLIVARVNDEHGGGAPSNDAGFVRIPGVADGVDPPVPATALMLWRVRVPAGTTSITDELIDDLRVPSRLAHEVVGNASLAAGAVTTSKIADSQVTAAKLAANAVTTAKIADSQVTAAKLAAAAVTSAKIANDAVDLNHLAAGAVTNTAIGTNAVSETKIGAAAVSQRTIAPSSTGTVDSGRIRYARLGDIVFVWTTSTTGANSATGAGAIPTGFRPAAGAQFPTSHYSTGASGTGSIATNGNVSLPASGHCFSTMYRAA